MATLAEGWLAQGPDDARDDARRILERDEYQPKDVPRPFRGVLDWLADRLEPVVDAIDRLLGHGWLGVLVLGGLVVLAVVMAALAIGRRNAAVAGTDRGSRRAARLDPDDLEREAAEAEQRGDLERALRLRFRAGLLRLDQVGAIRFHDGVTSRQVAADLRSPQFDALRTTFDEVVYGRRPASTPDLDQARTRWPELVDEVRR
jgi:hypothetical protein